MTSTLADFIFSGYMYVFLIVQMVWTYKSEGNHCWNPCNVDLFYANLVTNKLMIVTSCHF